MALPYILVVEDEPGIAENICYALETEGFRHKWAETGQIAQDLLDGVSFDLVLLDIGMPDMSGFELCRKIRNHSKVPIIFLTARSGEIDKIVGLEIGADDYIVKPFSPRELTARVRAVLRRTSESTLKATATSPSPLNQEGPFSLNDVKKAISYYGTRLELSRYEYRLLCVLIGRPGRVYSREELLTQAWEEPEASLDRTIDAHIKQIRAKLRAIRPEVNPIKTHRGMGYSLQISAEL
ncbi:MAG: two-component system response regulator CreB [Verrucomicrobiota bacterium]